MVTLFFPESGMKMGVFEALQIPLHEGESPYETRIGHAIIHPRVQNPRN